MATGEISSTNIDQMTIKGNLDTLLVKYDKDGNLLWQRNYDGSSDDDFRMDTINTKDNGIVLLFYAASNDIEGLTIKGVMDAVLVKYDKDGNLLWQKTYGGSGADIFERIIETVDGGFLAMGISESTDIPLFSNKNGIDIIVKFDKNGEVIWQQAYEYYDSGILLNQIYETSDNGFLLIGFQSGESIKTVIVKCDHNGNVYFEKKYDTRLKRFDDLGLSPTLNLKFGLIGGAPQIDLTGITNEYIETPVIKIIFESDDFKIMTNADKDPAETKVDNPKTNDNTLLNMIIGGISLTGLATTRLYIKKKYN